MKRVIVAVVALTLWGCSSSGLQVVPEAAVTTTSGTVSAQRSDPRTLRWLNIPYAEAPVGELRWRAPVPLKPSAEPIPPKTEPVMCPQMPGEASGTTGTEPVGSEDCLYLDVVAPTNFNGGSLPVMVWIHGGGNTTGYKGSYDFSELAAREQVVVVTLNYRLGPLGWFTHPNLQGAADGLDATSNFGHLDIIAALKWTQQNIEQFGGNPQNVTIFGESAGAHNVYALLVSPLADGLFHRAIAQSGYTTTVTPRQAVNRAREFEQIDRGSWELIEALGLDPDEVDPRSLRAVPAGRLLGIYDQLDKDHISPLSTADGIVIPEAGMLAAMADASLNKQVPVLAGSNRDEVTLWLGLNRYFVDGESVLLGALPPKMRIRDEALYRYWIDIRSRGWKARGVDEPLAALSAAGYSPLYAYRFDWDEQADSWFLPFSDILGAAHAAEIAFVMGKPMYGSIGDYMYPDTPSAAALTKHMMSAWANFARHGDPGAVAGQAWPPFVTEAPHTLILDSADRIRVEAQGESLDALLQEAAGESPLNATERCLLVWELVTNIGQPAYDRYRRWNNGECAGVDAREQKLAIRQQLEQQYGSANLP